MLNMEPGLIFRKVEIGKHSAPDELELWELEQSATPGRVPRISRLMNLAVLIEDMIRTGKVANQADFANRYHVSRNRVTQILSLLLLAPDIAEEIMFLPLVFHGPDPIKERMVRAITKERLWENQRKLWCALSFAK